MVNVPIPNDSKLSRTEPRINEKLQDVNISLNIINDDDLSGKGHPAGQKRKNKKSIVAMKTIHEQKTSKHWIKRGAAILCQLSQ